MAAGDGLVSMTPTSIAVGVGTASINADGGVDFTTANPLSLNGVFTSEIDNYLVVMRMNSDAGGIGIKLRLRASGTDNSTASSYTTQRLFGNGSPPAGSRNTSDLVNNVAATYDTQRAGFHLYLYGPFLAQPTAGRSVTAMDLSSASIGDGAFTHNQSTAYDGLSFIADDIFSGNVHVFGYEE